MKWITSIVGLIQVLFKWLPMIIEWVKSLVGAIESTKDHEKLTNSVIDESQPKIAFHFQSSQGWSVEIRENHNDLEVVSKAPSEGDSGSSGDIISGGGDGDSATGTDVQHVESRCLSSGSEEGVSKSAGRISEEVRDCNKLEWSFQPSISELKVDFGTFGLGGGSRAGSIGFIDPETDPELAFVNAYHLGGSSKMSSSFIV